MKKIYLLLLAMVSLMVFGLSFNKVEAASNSATYVASKSGSEYSVTTTGTAPEGSSASYTQTYSSLIYQMTSGHSMTLTLSGYENYKITGFTLSMRSNTSKGAGKLSYTNNGVQTYLIGSTDSTVKFNESAWNGAYTTEYVSIEKTIENGVIVTGTFEIKIECTTNSLYCDSFTVHYEEVASTPERDAVNAVESYMSLGFQYTENTSPAMLKKYQKITSLDELTTGTEVYLGAVTDNGAFISGGKDSGKIPEYLLSNKTKGTDALINGVEGAQALTVTKLDNGNFEFALDAETKLGATKSDLSFDNTNTEWTISISETGEATITNVAEVTNSVIKFNYNSGSYPRFKTYSETYPGPLPSLYKEVEVPGYVVTYTDSQFVIKCGISKEKADALASFGSYGIYVKSGTETRYYGSSETINVLVDETSGLYYVTISLGDVINNIGRATQTFEVGAFVKVGSEYLLSSNSKAYSVASIVKQYVEVENIDNPDVTDLYNLLADKDCYNA